MTQLASPTGQLPLYRPLHDSYPDGGYDNWRVWAGNLSIEIDGLWASATLSRAYLWPDRPAPRARVRCELFVADVPAVSIRQEHVVARVCTDAVDTGHRIPMQLLTGPTGVAEPCGANMVFESESFALEQTGAYTYGIEFSADKDHVEWVSSAAIAPNQDGTIVVSPGWIADGPTVTEVCVRKVGARVTASGFESGRILHLTACLEQIPTDVVYLLPFFRPGYTDLKTGEDVRKGRLGSPYAVADFYQIDPQLVTPPDQVDFFDMAAAGLLRQEDVTDVWARFDATSGQRTSAPKVTELVAAGAVTAIHRWGRDRLVQVVGRSELRQLCHRAHELGKRVIFDLVLMQTSRDAALITQHPEWYALDAAGQPKIHQIAWLVYSDVALFDLRNNRPLQDYLLDVAPYWMACCQLDGVRLDASQTVDRTFLRRLKNRIQREDPQALVLGETLCPLHEAVDIPVDMIYALLVDFHRDADQATPLIDFLEQVHAAFAPGTVAMAYFENHDSPRATQIWFDRYRDALDDDEALASVWRQHGSTDGIEVAMWMALLKNLQATLINATAGMWPGTQVQNTATRPQSAQGTLLAWAIEWGSQWGERAPTDFENETLLHPEAGRVAPGLVLARAYEHLASCYGDWKVAHRGRIYYHRDIDADDRILAYTRYTDSAALVAVHNLDIHRSRRVTIPLDWLPWTPQKSDLVFDSYAQLGLTTTDAESDPAQQGARIGVAPLQTRLYRLSATPS